MRNFEGRRGPDREGYQVKDVWSGKESRGDEFLHRQGCVYPCISMYIPHQDWLLTGWTLNTWMSTRNGLAERDSRTSHNTFHAGSQSTLHILYAARPALHTAPSTTHSTFCSSRAIQATQFRSTLATLYIANPTPHAPESLHKLHFAERSPQSRCGPSKLHTSRYKL